MKSLKQNIAWEIEDLNSELAKHRESLRRVAGEITDVSQRSGADKKYLIAEMTSLADQMQKITICMTSTIARRDALANILTKLERAE